MDVNGYATEVYGVDPLVKGTAESPNLTDSVPREDSSSSDEPCAHAGKSISVPPGPPLVQILVLPGNPGIAAFYVPFIEGLASHPAWGGRALVLAMSYKGHEPNPKAPGKVSQLTKRPIHVYFPQFYSRPCHVATGYLG